MRLNNLKDQALTLIMCMLFSSAYGSSKDKSKPQLLTVEKFTMLSGNEKREIDGEYYLAGERIWCKINIKNDKPKAFEGQWGIALCGNYEGEERRKMIETIIFESQEFSLKSKETVSDTILTDRIIAIEDYDLDCIFPIIKPKGGQWQIDESYDCTFEIVRNTPCLLTENIKSPSEVDKETPFTVYAPTECMNSKLEKGEDFQIILYKKGGQADASTSFYDKVHVISESKTGNYYHCRVPASVSDGAYKIGILPRNAPNKLWVSPTHDEFQHYAPQRSDYNGYAFQKDIQIGKDNRSSKK